MDDVAVPSLGRRLVAFLLAWLLRLLAASWRVTLRAPGGEARRVLAFWHGKQLGLLSIRRPAVALVSLSRDGELSSRVLARLGLGVVRGSSSRAGASGLRALVRRMRQGQDAVFAVDGPRGPLHCAKPGVALAARLAGAELCPVGVASRHAWVLSRAWCRFEIPWPFTRVAIVVGEPVDAQAALLDPELLNRALCDAERRAAERVQCDLLEVRSEAA